MKKLLSYLIIIFFGALTFSFSEDISDFEIEGISVDGSVLDYFTEETLDKTSKKKMKTRSLSLAESSPSYEIYTGKAEASENIDETNIPNKNLETYESLIEKIFKIFLIIQLQILSQ